MTNEDIREETRSQIREDAKPMPGPGPARVLSSTDNSTVQERINEQIRGEQTAFYPPGVAPTTGDADVHLTTAAELAQTMREAEGNKA